MSQEINISPRDEDYNEWNLGTPHFNENFNKELKARVPVHDRRWDGESLVWVVSDRWKDFAVEVAQRYFPTATVVVNDDD